MCTCGIVRARRTITSPFLAVNVFAEYRISMASVYLFLNVRTGMTLGRTERECVIHEKTVAYTCSHVLRIEMNNPFLSHNF